MLFHRRRPILLLVGLALVTGLATMPAGALGARPDGEGARYLVVLREPGFAALPTRRGGLRPGAAALAQQQAAATSATIDTLEADIGFHAGLRYTHAVSGFAAVLTDAQVLALVRDGRVASIRRTRPVELAGDEQVVPPGVARIRAQPDDAPAQTADVSVAVVDTGIGHFADGQWRHEHELNVVGGVDAYDPEDGACGERVARSAAAYDDTNGHGTHVAGTIGAIDNAVGVVGVAPGVKLYSVRVFEGGFGSDATVICGLDWIYAWNTTHPSESEDIDVVNMSLRGFAPANRNAGCETPGNADAEELAICRVVASGASVVVAAGNEADPVSRYVPSRYESVITVSAISDFDGLPGGLASETCVPPRGTEVDDTFAKYSNYGPEVDVAAPGTCVRSTPLDSATGTVTMSGTSMAAPHVTGAIARYLALHPATTPAAVRAHLVDAASLDWNASTDPDTEPDRLVDTTALLSETPGLAVDAVPGVVTIPAGTLERTVRVRLQRLGGYDGTVTLDTGDLPAGVAGATFTTDDTLPGSRLGRTLALVMDPSPPDGERELTIIADGGPEGPRARTTLTLRFDATPPVIGTPWPRAVLTTGSWSREAPVRLSWTATDAQGALDRQEIQRSVGRGSFTTVSRPGAGASEADTTARHGVRTAWRIRAVDLAGNATLSSTLVTRLTARQSGDAVLSDGWTARSRDSASDGNLVVTSTAGRTATLTFSGRSVAIVAPAGEGKGRFRVHVDGEVAGMVNLASGPTGPRRIVFASGPLAAGTHSIALTSLSGTVELDAFLILR